MSSESGAYRERRSPSARFLPPDPRVREPHRLTPQLALRVGILGVFALVVFGVLFLRLWSLQVLSGDEYLNAAQNNQLRLVRIEAPRGPILDRHGRVIVSNVAGTAVQLWVGDMPEAGPARARRAPRGRSPRLTPRALPRGGRAPGRPAHAGHGQDRGRRGPGRLPPRAPGRVPRGRDRPGLPPGLRVRGARRPDPGLHRGDLARGAEGAPAGRLPRRRPDRQDGRRGIVRHVPPGHEGARPDPRRLARTAAVESGAPPGGEARYALRLTLDVRLQRAAELALRHGIDLAHENDHWAANGGAIVALDPRDGAVLAMASSPSFKPSVYVGRTNPREAPRRSSRRRPRRRRTIPGLNRATAGLYPPGSTWKPVTALAGMQEHVLSAYDSLQCTPTAEYGLDRQVFRNWNPYVNRPMTLPEALAESCDTYFYEIGNRFYERGSGGARADAAVGTALRLRPADGPRHRRRGGGPAPRRPTGGRRRSRATGTAPGTPETRSSSRSVRRTCS